MNKISRNLMSITLAGAALVATSSAMTASAASITYSSSPDTSYANAITESAVAPQETSGSTKATLERSMNKTTNNKYEVAGIDDPAVVQTFFVKLQQAVKKNDKKTVSTLVHYPLRVNSDSGTYSFTTPERFIAKYNSIITPKVKKAIVSSTEKDLFATWQGVATEGGDVWMGIFNTNMGIEAINK
ncbi:hypothetical protein [Paenibacillus kandeliae]|uniref:hypothetical protein n=1 Tax=Paenibacillus kandeliae TaxID=3231269 RepID=UPI00345A8B4B